MKSLKEKLYEAEENVQKRIEKFVYETTDNLDEFQKKQNYDLLCRFMKLGARLMIEEIYEKFNIE